MTRETNSPDELAQAFDYDGDITDIPDGIWNAMVYIDSNTGLLGDYNDGKVCLKIDGQKILWFARSRVLSAHNRLLHWVQEEADDIMLGTIEVRQSPGGDRKVPFVQISPKERWGYDDE